VRLLPFPYVLRICYCSRLQLPILVIGLGFNCSWIGRLGMPFLSSAVIRIVFNRQAVNCFFLCCCLSGVRCEISERKNFTKPKRLPHDYVYVARLGPVISLQPSNLKAKFMVPEQTGLPLPRIGPSSKLISLRLLTTVVQSSPIEARQA
jgi:hypothetical protein